MFASDHYNLKPDIICLAKGIASGLPLGACVARADLMDWQPGAHASTFGGNPVALAASLKTIELLENGLIQNSKEVGDYLQSGLKKVMDKYQDHIVDVRGLGLMVGVEFVESRKSMKPARELRNLIERKAFQNGLILLGAGHSTIRWSPPLILTKENADVAVEIFDQVIGASL
jgi:4-aminobutyrate aminotransferase